RLARRLHRVEPSDLDVIYGRRRDWSGRDTATQHRARLNEPAGLAHALGEHSLPRRDLRAEVQARARTDRAQHGRWQLRAEHQRRAEILDPVFGGAVRHDDAAARATETRAE